MLAAAFYTVSKSCHQSPIPIQKTYLLKAQPRIKFENKKYTYVKMASCKGQYKNRAKNSCTISS